MGRSKNLLPTLIDLPLQDSETGDITVIVETPKGSHNKYKYDPECRALRLASVLGEGLSFPYDFGFFPSTQGDDGDPLDVLLFLDYGVPPCTVVSTRLIGVLEIRQRSEKEKHWERNDRFFAVATHAHDHGHLKTLDDLRPHMIEEIESFFGHYAGLNGKQLEVLARKGPRRAHKLLKAGAKKFEGSR
jgi:inorganic pyrophosphatase